jgi:hypothetical protein
MADANRATVFNSSEELPRSSFQTFPSVPVESTRQVPPVRMRYVSLTAISFSASACLSLN